MKKTEKEKINVSLKSVKIIFNVSIIQLSRKYFEQIKRVYVFGKIGMPLSNVNPSILLKYNYKTGSGMYVGILYTITQHLIVY